MVLSECRKGSKNGTHWLDMRGNHDAFDVLENHDEFANPYLTHAATGIGHARSYLEQVTLNDKLVSFVSVDATPIPGLKRPFNFFGYIDNDELTEIQAMKAKAEDDLSDYTIYFGHYPTSAVTVANNSLR